MKTNVPQFELPEAETVFNLVTETAIDGDHLAADLERQREVATVAKELEAKQQPTLF